MQSPCLPLLRTDKLVWTKNETFEGDAQMANFLKEKLKGAVVDWKLEYLNGSVYKGRQGLCICLNVWAST